MSDSVPRTFCELLNKESFGAVVIPIIQRDFAQGRESAVEIREQFVEALYGALTAEKGSYLDLDFVYGSVEAAEDGEVFCLLDGQQRLTTLFLLHWYLALKDGMLAAFRSVVIKNERARFSYRVRPSAEEFCDALVLAELELNYSESPPWTALSDSLRDQPWFFLAWEQDPTVASMLAVLDTIHERFWDTATLYPRLVDQADPAITFQFLNLRDFGLSDELYIKMNARGKPLTSFEAFKARLAQKLDELLPDVSFTLETEPMSARCYFGHRVDTAWADLFWRYKDKTSPTFDRQFMNFVRGLSTVAYSQIDPSKSDKDTVLQRLGDEREDYTFLRYEADGCLTTHFAKLLVGVLDRLSGSDATLKRFLPLTTYYDEEDMFRRILWRERQGVVQSEWVQFYAYCCYLVKHDPVVGDEQFHQWMRVISNLAANTIINRSDDFDRALKGVHAFLDDLGFSSVLEFVADSDNAINGLNNQQVREERLKAQLMLRSEQWQELILEAEEHAYFQGQIEFLLDFCGVLDRWLEFEECNWSEAEDEAFRDDFAVYLAKASTIIGNTGLEHFDGFLWERALLTKGDYTLRRGKNRSFLDARDREASWKRLLRAKDDRDSLECVKRHYVRDLLDLLHLDDIEGSLQAVVDDYLAAGNVPDHEWWRWAFVSCPAAIACCGKRFFRHHNARRVYLLSKEQMNSRHSDLLTFTVYKRLEQIDEDGALTILELSPYISTANESEEPSIELKSPRDGFRVLITNEDGRARIQLSREGTGLEDGCGRFSALSGNC